ncbi:ABC transporter permease [Marinactinospora thermotolerans]|uniref:ABC transporter permease n=1 Tax=Marinactinospora thermotolerans TaxID=531310 RepID=UPI001F471588|nr:ABC transporter permease subunit [Marinactinospora thermotolerans]
MLVVLFVVVFGVIVVAPLAVIGLAAVAASWRGVLPGGLTGAHLAAATGGDALASALVSVQTALIASAGSVLLGGWAAFALHGSRGRIRRLADGLLHLPMAVPSVVVGLGLLVAFSHPPLLLNGTRWIVLIAHLVLVLPFSYSTVSAALERADPDIALVAACLGASPARVLLTVRLPLALPALAASAGLALALSMGELGATIMLYPPDWRTLPVGIFAQSDRGALFAASASTVVLLGLTLVGLLALNSVRTRAAER